MFYSRGFDAVIAEVEELLTEPMTIERVEGGWKVTTGDIAREAKNLPYAVQQVTAELRRRARAG